MEVKEMRSKLKDVVDVVPQKNVDVIKLYNEKFDANEVAEEVVQLVKLVKDNVYTYVGAGDEPPGMIKFMGIQVFMRGQSLPPATSEKIYFALINMILVKMSEMMLV